MRPWTQVSSGRLEKPKLEHKTPRMTNVSVRPGPDDQRL